LKLQKCPSASFLYLSHPRNISAEILLFPFTAAKHLHDAWYLYYAARAFKCQITIIMLAINLFNLAPWAKKYLLITLKAIFFGDYI
jgi:predicted amidohydrolase